MPKSFTGFLAIPLLSVLGITFAAWPPDSPGPKLPFAIHWNLAHKDNFAVEEFIAKEHRIYTFSVAFRYADKRSSAEDFKKLEQFTGDASVHRVTKESAGTDNPVQVNEYTEDEEDFMKRGGILVGGATKTAL